MKKGQHKGGNITINPKGVLKPEPILWSFTNFLGRFSEIVNLLIRISPFFIIFKIIIYTNKTCEEKYGHISKI